MLIDPTFLFIQKLIVETALPAWAVSRCAETLVVGGEFSGMAAIGLLIRHAESNLTFEDTRTLAVSGKGPAHLAEAEAWLKGEGAEYAEEGARIALFHADRLMHWIDSLDDAEVGSLNTFLLQIALDRDELQSVLAACRLAGTGTSLESVLKAVDEVAEVHMIRLGELEIDEADTGALEILNAAANKDPDAWWADMVR